MSHSSSGNECHQSVCMPPNWDGTFCPTQIIEMVGGVSFAISSVQTISSDCGGEEEVFEEFDGDFFADYNFNAGDIIEVTLEVRSATGNSWLTGLPCQGEACYNDGGSVGSDGELFDIDWDLGCMDCDYDVANMSRNKSWYTKTWFSDADPNDTFLSGYGYIPPEGTLAYAIHSGKRLPGCYFPFDENDYSDRTIVGETITVSPQSYTVTITQFWIDSNTNSVIDYEGPCETIGQVPPNDYGDTCILYRPIKDIFVYSVFDTIRLLCGIGGPLAPECPTEVRGIED